MTLVSIRRLNIKYVYTVMSAHRPNTKYTVYTVVSVHRRNTKYKYTVVSVHRPNTKHFT